MWARVSKGVESRTSCIALEDLLSSPNVRRVHSMGLMGPCTYTFWSKTLYERLLQLLLWPLVLQSAATMDMASFLCQNTRCTPSTKHIRPYEICSPVQHDGKVDINHEEDGWLGEGRVFMRDR